MINDLMSADASAEGGDLRNIYKVGLNTTRLLMVLGDVVCALAAAAPGRGRAGEAATATRRKDKAFYEGKVAAAQFFAHTNLPEAHRRAGHRRGHRPVADGPRRGRLLI